MEPDSNFLFMCLTLEALISASFADILAPEFANV